MAEWRTGDKIISLSVQTIKKSCEPVDNANIEIAITFGIHCKLEDEFGMLICLYFIGVTYNMKTL